MERTRTSVWYPQGREDGRVPWTDFDGAAEQLLGFPGGERARPEHTRIASATAHAPIEASKRALAPPDRKTLFCG